MGKLIVYNFITANGYYKGPGEDISWAKGNTTEEEKEFSGKNSNAGNILLFGRVTYEMMQNYWPTEMAAKNDPATAEGMNKAEKIVFSKTLQKATWNNTRIVKDNIEAEVKKLKDESKGMTILGSGSIVNQLAEKGLIDEFQLMIYPVFIGNGTTFLKDITGIDLEFISSKSFKNGAMLHNYKPKKK